MRAVIRFLTLAVIAALPFLWAAPVQASSGYTFDIRIGESCVYGTGPVSQNVAVVLTSSSGHRLDKLTDHADSSGNWSACLTKLLAPGMSVTAKHDTLQRSVTVPELSLSDDRVTNVASGKAPVGAVVSLTAMRCSFHGVCTQHDYPVTTDSGGHYSLDLESQAPAWDLLGGDDLDLTQTASHGDLFEVPLRVAEMIVDYPSLVAIEDAPVGSSQTVKLKTSDGTLRAEKTKVITETGANLFNLKKNGASVTIKSGNLIKASFASDAHLTWDVALAGHTGTGHVTGSCFDNAPIIVGLTSTSGGENFFGTAAADGTFDLDFTGGGGVHSGDQLSLTCEASTGDEITYGTTVP